MAGKGFGEFMNSRFPRVLVVYATHHGQTEAVARRLASAVGESAPATVRAVATMNNDSLHEFDAVAVLGSVHMGKHQAELVEWVAANSDRLRMMPSLFISVSMAAARGDPDGDREAADAIEKFANESDWKADTTAAVAGALKYPEYGRFPRWIMKQIARKTGLPTDTSRTWEFTDWSQVDRLGDELAHAACAAHGEGILKAGHRVTRRLSRPAST
jgi:menaquinone-dependent protoporphyrinogen oxidase